MKSIKLYALVAGFALLLGACGGGGGSSTTSSTSGSTGTSSSTTNSVSVIVDNGPAAAGGTINEPFVSVTICSPSSPSTCQTIDHILVDTGSFGLRIISSVLSTSLTLPLETDASGDALAECAMFADGYSWGPLRQANLQIGGESATSLPIQVIGDPSYTGMVPSDCSSTGSAENTVATFGANGVIGLGPFVQDCGDTCVTSNSSGFYYVCNTSCQATSISLAQQVPNPVPSFADNNGSSLYFPAVGANGTADLTGTLTFGIGTQSNNALGSATVYTTDDYGYIVTQYNGESLPDSFLDSGSNGYFFNNNSITQCSDGSGFYCPSSPLSLSAVIVGQNGSSGTVDFIVGNTDDIVNNNPNSNAFSEIAGTNSDSEGFDWGLPFFFGRTVYTAIQGYTTPGGTGPYFAF